MHLNRSFLNPQNDSFIFPFHKLDLRKLLSFASIHCQSLSLTSLNILGVVISGLVNGLVCLCHHQEPAVILWNPAIKQLKIIPVPSPKSSLEMLQFVTAGLGFDSLSNDFKIIHIMRYGLRFRRYRVEVYSSDVNGTPYWKSIKDYGRICLVAFDCHSELFREVKDLEYAMNKKTNLRLVNFMDSLAALVYSPGEKSNHWVDVYTLNESAGSWTKKYTAGGPILSEVIRLSQCFKKTGEIVVAIRHMKMSLYDPKTNSMKNIGTEAFPYWPESFGYVESLVFIKGMKPIGKEDSRRTRPSLAGGPVYLTHKLYKWRNPKCNGVLPPGSMGLPFIGETLQLIMPSASLDLPPFIKNRMKRSV